MLCRCRLERSSTRRQKSYLGMVMDGTQEIGGRDSQELAFLLTSQVLIAGSCLGSMLFTFMHPAQCCYFMPSFLGGAEGQRGNEGRKLPTLVGLASLAWAG